MVELVQGVERAAAVVLERTSGDEAEGQDVRAQGVQTVHRAGVVGFDVLKVYEESDVPGDTPWEKRPVLQEARLHAERAGAVLVVREVSRLWRGAPALGRQLVETIPDLGVLGKSHWSRRAGEWVRDEDTDELMRLIDLWDSWREKRKTQERTALAMREIKAGRRKTRSGKPPGRPVVEIEPEHLVAARAILDAGGSMMEAHREVLSLRGYYDAKDPRTQAKRKVSKARLGEALGLYKPSSVRNSVPSETPDAPTGEVSDAKESVADGGSA